MKLLAFVSSASEIIGWKLKFVLRLHCNNAITSPRSNIANIIMITIIEIDVNAVGLQS